VFAWGLALVALGFVVHSVPVRDSCVDPEVAAVGQDAKPARVAVSREADSGGGCVVHRPEGDARLAAPECAKLSCEPGLLSTLAGARLGLLAAFLAVYFLGPIAWAARWRVLLGLANVRLSVPAIWRITVEAQAGGIVLPGGMGGDALRVAFVAQRGGKLSAIITSVLIERVIGLVTMTGLAVALAATALDGGAVPPLLPVLASIPVAFVVGVALLRWEPFTRLPPIARGPLAKVLRPVLEYVREPGAPRSLALAAAISLIMSSIQLVTIRGIVASLGGVPTSEAWIYLGTTMSFIATSLPALPGGWGTGDLAFVFFFRNAGLPASTALGVSMLFRLFSYVVGAVGAVLYVLRTSGRVRAEATASPE
jgi:uncharacterized membrane protein YbhN (UPF0104 family)